MDLTSKIYVAGHRGLVGSAILRKLKELRYGKLSFRSSREVDLRRQSDTETLFQDEKPEYVFLAAAKVGGILANMTYQAEFIYDNIAIATNVIQAAYSVGVRKLLNLGSSCIYPKFCTQPMKEDALLTGTLEPTNEPYAIAKIAAIKLCRYYNEQYDTNFISIMPTNLYGPNDNFNLETAHVLPALIRKFHLGRLLRKKNLEGIQADIRRFSIGFGLDGSKGLEQETSVQDVLKRLGITKEAVVVWGSGNPHREFLYVDDLADAALFILERYDAKDIGEFVNIGRGEDAKIKDLASLVKDVIGFEGEIEFDHSRPDGTPRKLLDVSRMKSLGWEAKTPLEEGIRRTYEWYLDSMRPCG
jgi:GDP-L-fucose synthase